MLVVYIFKIFRKFNFAIKIVRYMFTCYLYKYITYVCFGGSGRKYREFNREILLPLFKGTSHNFHWDMLHLEDSHENTHAGKSFPR